MPEPDKPRSLRAAHIDALHRYDEANSRYEAFLTPLRQTGRVVPTDRLMEEAGKLEAELDKARKDHYEAFNAWLQAGAPEDA
jgi:hypothetical protein